MIVAGKVSQTLNRGVKTVVVVETHTGPVRVVSTEIGPQEGAYAASVAVARGDVLLAAGRDAEARAAYTEARVLAAQDAQQGGLASLDQKLASLTPVPARELSGAGEAAAAASPEDEQ